MEHVALRFPEPADADAVYAAVRESIVELHRWMSWCRLDFALADAERWIGEQPAARAGGQAFEFLIVDGEGRLLGCCGINQIDPVHRRANFGYWVRSSATRRGIARRAASQLAEWAFAHTDLERLEILAAAGNAASQAVALAIGAQREGLLRSRLLIHGTYHDAAVFSLIRP